MIRSFSTCRWWYPLLQQQQQQQLLAGRQAAFAASAAAAKADASEGPGNHSSSAQPMPNGVIVLPMPALSHSMVSGKVGRWLKQQGDSCEMYDLLLEVETETLVEEAYRLDDFAGKVRLLIETQEECTVAKILVQEGQEVPVGTPIAVLCEEPEQLRRAAEQAAAVMGISNVYEGHAARTVRTLVWQSYLKESKKEPGSSCGCM